MKYLIEIHHGIGDIVQMTGVIESLVQYDKEAYIAVIVNKDQYKELFKCDNRVKNFFRIDLKGMTKLQVFKEVIRMRKEHFDYLFLSPISNYKASRILVMFIGARISVGEQLEGGRKPWRYVKKKDIHIVKRNENLLKLLDKKIKIFSPKLLINNIDMDVEIGKKAIGLCIGTSIPQKTWKLERYLKIANEFILLGYNIILLGGEKEANLLESFQLSSEIINLAGKLSLIQSAKIASKCCLVVGGDTGIMHMAAAVGTRTLTLFSCTDPRLHCPYSDQSYFYNVKLPCQYCYEKGIADLCTEYKCIDMIKIEKVKKLMISILNNKIDNKYKFSDTSSAK